MKIAAIIISIMILASPVLANKIVVGQATEIGCNMIQKLDGSQLTTATVNLRVQRKDTGNYLTDSNTWTSASTDLIMTEIDSVEMPGIYVRDITIGSVLSLRFTCIDAGGLAFMDFWTQTTCSNRMFC